MKTLTMTALVAAMIAAGPAFAQTGTSGAGGAASASGTTSAGTSAAGTTGVATGTPAGSTTTATGIKPADGSNPKAEAMSGATGTVAPGDRVLAAPAATVVTPAPATVLGAAPAGTTVRQTTIVSRHWVNVPANVEARGDFQRWMALR
jgi:hypothetical protein